MNDNHGICCVCGHRLDRHIDEGEWWRCHSLGPDSYQCECRLLKHLDEEYGLPNEGIEGYDLGKRIDEVIAELKRELKI